MSDPERERTRKCSIVSSVLSSGSIANYSDKIEKLANHVKRMISKPDASVGIEVLTKLSIIALDAMDTTVNTASLEYLPRNQRQTMLEASSTSSSGGASPPLIGRGHSWMDRSGM